MTTAIQKLDTLGSEKLELLKRTLCPDLTDDELDLFGYHCARTGLDPFAKQIYATKRKGKRNSDEPAKLTIQTGIDGFRVVASRTGELDGQEGPYWCGPDGVWREVWLADFYPSAAKVIVFRKGCSRGFVGVARFDEYAQRYVSGDLSGQWPKMPAVMIAKCAEALALRKAFPQDLSGIYTTEEMGQADNPEPEPQPKPEPVKAKVIDAKPNKAAAPAPELPAAPVEEMIDGDPVTDVKALTVLAASNGLDWVMTVKAINTKFGAKYGITRTLWLDITREHREATVKAFQAMADKVTEPERKPETAADVQRLTGEVAALMKLEPIEVFRKLCGAAGWEEIVGYDDLRTTQIAEACKSLRAKLAGLQPKGGA